MEKKERVVVFHIGRGGRHYNGGHMTFCRDLNSLQDAINVDDDLFIVKTDEENNPLPDEEWAVYDGGGYIVLQGKDEIESPVGELDIDGIYDTTIAKYISDCDDSEIQHILASHPDNDLLIDAMGVYSDALSVEDLEGNCILISTNKDALIDAAISEDDTIVVAGGHKIWQSGQGEYMLRQILSKY